jgi:hypothetical protein
MGRHLLGMAAAERCRVVTYSAYDPLEMPKALADVLPRFDGRPPNRVLREIAAEAGLKINEAVLRKLVDFGVLHEPHPASSRPP